MSQQQCGACSSSVVERIELARELREKKYHEDKQCVKCSITGSTESSSSSSSLWYCTTAGCVHIGCGRYLDQHALDHYNETQHPTAIEFNSFQLYCYRCDSDYDVATPLQDEKRPLDDQIPPIFSTSSPVRPVGLQNLGNTCYLNSTVQVLM